MTVVINGTSGITDVNGSAAAPAITGTDTDTGVFFGTNTVSLSTGGTERLQIDSSGNAGLGVTPSSWATITALQVKNASFTGYSNEAHMNVNAYYNAGWKYIASDYAARYVQSSGSHYWFNAPSGTAGNAISFTQAMTLDASGKLLVGSSSSIGSSIAQFTDAGGQSALFNTSSASGAYVGWFNNGTGNGYIGAAAQLVGSGAAGNFCIRAQDNLVFASGGSFERARIDSSGNLLVGVTANGLGYGGIQLQTAGNGAGIPLIGVGGNSSSNGNLTMAVFSTSAGQYQFYVGYGGTVYARSTSITGLSDQREKENIKTLDVGLAEVLALQPRRFDWKDGSSSNVAGFVAQEVELVLPDLVEEYKLDETETRFGLKMGDMIPVLVKAIQEQQALIASQSEIITQLQADVAALKGQA